MEHVNALPAGTRLAEYEVVDVLGTGGFGITYRAWDTTLEKYVAIKEYLPRDFATRTNTRTVVPTSQADRADYEWGLTRFLDEARTLARFDHPHVNKVHRHFEAHGTAYLVLEYVEGETLSAVLERRGRLDEAQIEGLLTDVLSGLEEVHAAGFVHRDLKPGNLMVRPDGNVVVLDFGAARQAVGQRSKSITSILTPGYAPIEQYDTKAEDVGPWSDIYALGMVAYRCISGLKDGDLPDAVTRSRAARKGSGDVEPTVSIGQGRYDARLLRAIDWAITLEEDARPQSIGEWRTALPPLDDREMSRSSQPPVAEPERSKSSSLRWATVAGVVALVVAVGAGAYWFGQRAPVMPTEQTATPESRQADSPASQEPVSASPDEGEPVVSSVSVVPEPTASTPPDPAAMETALGLEREERVLVQQGLAAAGQEPGPTDGLFGGEQTRTRQAIRAWQAAKRLAETGYLTREQADTLLALGQEAEEERRVAEAQAADEAAYTEAQRADTAAAYGDYLATYPDGRHADEARQAAREAAARQAREADEAAYAQAEREDTAVAYGEYLQAYPQGHHVQEARARQATLQEAARQEQEAARRAQADDAAYAAAERADTAEGYKEYLQAYPQGRHVAEARRRQRLRQWRAGQTFRDDLRSGGKGPEIVVVPPGSFMMGCVSGGYCPDDEQPVHRVIIEEPFAVGKYEVTFAEWDACVTRGGCQGYRPDDHKGRGRRPVMNVNWEDAQAYVTWLSGETGQAYRLLSEAEWEYVARAGTTTKYWWGDEIGRNRANCDGCGSQWDPGFIALGQAAPVGSFAANGWGLYDVHGTVDEWVQDCWNESYAGAPGDGRAWESGDCSHRVLRGGNWSDKPWFLRSAYRNKTTAGDRGNLLGFRIARSLD